ncbi:Methionyl-tRNA synthetase [Spirochaeta thermophila DSM 6578]|uniref:Methionine--tRNA ligase n=1 Tax=Winmispira thermophila (strain ATCC 700085 / DSM 6578 / Z-1203) TaxID=869211 RepID=G0GDW5_WINT7|nr:methionine--tRNA ligase [Spirochaeta thermophila]AEJ60597.1 Methionyl-tRNA synthetase [Spirochaeta thermophila DSM 6578]
MKKKRLITSALPYVNNVPHLGNLIQVLSADVFARYCRSAGYETLYVCGTDEYGTATETRALEEGISPKELCDRFHAIHTEIYEWFEIQFDKWGRTSTPEHTRITQDIFLKLDRNGYIKERTIQQLYSEKSDMFLADRYVRGTCPHCGYEDARGDQCEHCGKLLDPTELIDPRSAIDGSTPVLRETKHLYLDLPALLPKLKAWMEKASVEGRWATNAIRMTESWIRDGLRERCITRDLKWGVPVPKPGYENKVFYVWFDAPIGYISITATYTDRWEEWWKNPDEVELYQFIGKDNIPFHTVIFPSTLLGTGEEWTLLKTMSSTEYLNYESGKFSKSRGVGVFGNDAKDTGIPADVWRFYLFYNRPETSDYTFTWKDFQEKVNGELIGNFANLVNRTLSFIHRFYQGRIPEAPTDTAFWGRVRELEEKITEYLEGAQLRDAFRTVFALSDLGNKAFQAGEPWKTRTENPEEAEKLLRHLAYLVRDLAILVEPYLPATSRRILEFLGNPPATWAQLGRLEGLSEVRKPEILFERLEDDRVEALRIRFSGTQAEREESSRPRSEDVFRDKVRLVVAKITEVRRHPNAEKLYIEKIDLGGRESQIVSGLVPYYKEEELLGRHVIVVENLKPAKLRGEMSHGMLLAAEAEGSVEVLFADHAAPGTRVALKGDDPTSYGEAGEITIDEFFSVPITVKGGVVRVGETPLVADGREITTSSVKEGKVG